MNTKNLLFFTSILLMGALVVLAPILYLKVWPNNFFIQLEGEFARISVQFISNHLYNPIVLAVVYMNHSLEKILNVVVLLAFSIYAIYFSNGRRRIMCVHFVYMLIVLELGVYLNNKLFFHWFAFNRISPNLALELPTLQSLYENSSGLKSVSYATFPGGHAFACFLWAFIYSYTLNKSNKILFFTAAAIISIPRVLVGLHWVSDALFAIYLAYFYSLLAFSIPGVRQYFAPNSSNKRRY